MEVVQLNTDWEYVSCPICLDFPHNGVLLQCSSYEKGCRPYVCDTDHLHSNCLDRFKRAHGMLSGPPSPSTSNATSIPIESTNMNNSEATGKPICPLCRGEVTGWVVVKMARVHLDKKKRCCEEEQCSFMGTYDELREHAQLEHPHARPSKIDPARQLDWENFQQSSEIIDVLSTIHSEVPRGVVLGDYVIEYGDDDSGDDFEDFPGDEGNWWTSCILYQVFDNFRTSRNRRRSRASESRRGSHRSSDDTSNSDEGSVTSTEDEFVSTNGLSRSRADHHSTSETKWIIAVECPKGLADVDPFLVECIEKELMLLFQTCRSFLKKMLSDVPTRHDFQVHVIMLSLLSLYLYFVPSSWLFRYFQDIVHYSV